MSSNLAAQAAVLKSTLGAITGATASLGDYGILVSATSYALVIWPGTGDMHDIAMGGVWGYDDVMMADAYVRDTGTPESTGLACFTLIDAVKDAIDGNETLTSTCQVVRVEYDVQGEVVIDGHSWIWLGFRFPTEQF